MEYPIPVTVVQFADSEAFRCTASGQFYADGGVRISRPFKFDDGHNALADPRDIEFCEVVLPDGTVLRRFFEIVAAPVARRSFADSVLTRARSIATNIARASLIASVCFADVVFGSSAVDADVPHRVDRHKAAMSAEVSSDAAASALIALALVLQHRRQ